MQEGETLGTYPQSRESWKRGTDVDLNNVTGLMETRVNHVKVEDGAMDLHHAMNSILDDEYTPTNWMGHMCLQ